MLEYDRIDLSEGTLISAKIHQKYVIMPILLFCV